MSEGPWAVSQLTAWLRHVGPKVDTLGPFELLEISATDDMELIRAAYHRVAATRHPDLFRGKLGAQEAEQLMRLFARVSGAYAQLRDPEERKKHGARPKATPKATPPAGTPAGAMGTPTSGVRKVAPRALSHLRKAEAMLNTGDVASAVLHLRMAIAADPQAKELRQLLADTEAKLKK
jgi:curved DNA-binding protein CbpA